MVSYCPTSKNEKSHAELEYYKYGFYWNMQIALN